MRANPSNLACGTVLGRRYRLDAVIGEGAMGTVWRALDLTHGAAVAVKILHDHLGVDAGMIARFEREIAAGRRVAHPNLVPVLDDGSVAGVGRYLVMPLLEGTDLRREIEGGVGLVRTLAFAEQMLAALEHMHGLGLVHRDVKPENLRVVRDASGCERLMLLDFGLVKPIGAVVAEPKLTEYGRVFGTPWYMAPEQALGTRIDHHVDLYSAGVVIYEMLCGVPPFEGTLVQVLHHQVHTPPPALPSWVPPALAHVIATMLAKDPVARPATAAIAAAALRQAIRGVASRPTVVETWGLGELEPASDRPVSMLRASNRAGRVATFVFAAAACVAAAFAIPWGTAMPEATPAPAVATHVVSAPASSNPEPAAPVTPAPTAVRDPIVQPPSLAPSSVAVVQPVAVAPVETVRGSGSHASAPATVRPHVHRPAPRPRPSEPAPIPTLHASKPPRVASKLPGVDAASRVTRDRDGTIHLRPRSS